jgi:hypothetical protein
MNTLETIKAEIERRSSFIKDQLIGQSPEDLPRHYRLIGQQDAFKGMLQFLENLKENQHPVRFRLYRTSDWRLDDKPCEGAVPYVDGEGKKAWAIEISDLDELLSLQDIVGEELIVGWAFDTEGMRSIEIYDSYRE